MFARVNALVLRLIGPAIGGFVAFLAAHGIALPPEFGRSAEAAVVLLVMGVVTVAVNFVVGKAGPLIGGIIDILGFRGEE